MSCGTSANAMSLVTQTSRPIRGKGADVMFGLSALSAGSRLQDLTTTTSIKRCLPNLTMLLILPWQIQMLLQLRVFVIQQGGRWWIRKHCWIPHSFSFLPSCLKKAWIHKYPYGFQLGQIPCIPVTCDTSFNTFFSCLWSFHLSTLMGQAHGVIFTIWLQITIFFLLSISYAFMLVLATKVLSLFKELKASQENSRKLKTTQGNSIHSDCRSIPIFRDVLVPVFDASFFSRDVFSKKVNFSSLLLVVS